jgi:hypothetical protein
MLNALWKAWNSNDMLKWKSMNWWLHILKCKTCVKKLMRLKLIKGSCIRSKDFTIQMSLFLYLLNMVTIIRISYPEKSNRVQSRSCHVSLIKLDIVFIKLKINEFSISLLLSWHWWNWFEFLLETFVICFAKYHCILDLNATCLVCKAFLIHTFYKNKSPCFSPFDRVA